MNSRMSCSLLPAASWLRISLRRSTASGALESASVWFWHTRQRSSWARSLVLFSSNGSSAATALENSTRNKSRCLTTAVELLHQRHDLLPGGLGRERADVLVADHALAVDDVGFGHAVHAVVDADAAGGVEYRELVRVAVALEPGQRVLARVLVVQPDHRRDARARELADHRVLDQAGRAPRGPDVEDPHAAQHVFVRERLLRRVEPRQLEARRGLADERRGHFARIERQADREQRDQRDKNSDDPVHPHAATFTSSSVF